MKNRANRIVLAYSGGLTSTVAIPWLAEKHGAEIVTITLDMGQGGEELEGVRDQALAAGAVRAHVLDVREEFARDYIVRALKADATADANQPMPAALGRPVIAKKLVEIAGIEQAPTVAHGCGPAGREPAGLDAAIRALSPALVVMAPARDWELSRVEAIEYAAARGMTIPVTLEKPYGVDANVWGRAVDCAGADPWCEPPEELFTLTTAAAACPNEPAYVDIAFERGVPTSVNGVTMPIIDLIGTVGMIAGTHGVGRIDMMDTRSPGVRTREVSEAPAAVVLHAAHAELLKLATSKDANKFSRKVSRQYADLVERGLWFSPLRDALDAFVDKAQERVTGAIRLKLFKSDCRIVGRKVVEPARASGRRLRVVSKTH
jgi:argininosuccinate synthase